MSATQRVVAAAVAALVVIAAAVLISTLAGGPIGRAPDASDAPAASAEPTTSPAPSDPEPSASAGPTSPEDEEVLAVLAEIEEQVIVIRGLAAADVGAPDIITRDELGPELEALFERNYPPDEREEDNRALRALGLLGPDEDVAELQLQLLGDQVLGFYDEVENRMVVVTDEGLDANAKLTYAHEYTHALQDAAFAPTNFDAEADLEDDQALALTAQTEGDATVTMLAWALAHLSQQELAEIASAPEPDTTGIPSWMVNQLLFPYSAGQLWAGALTVNPLQPDFAELDASYADPPDSTEQIMHLEKWEPREDPVAVEVPDLAAALGGDWEEVDNTPIGEASIGFMLQHFGIAADVANEAAAGWGGDRVRIAAGPNDAFAVTWRLAWDTPADADEFVLAYEAVIGELPFPAMVRLDSEDEVLVVHASDEEVLRRATGAAG
jgi:hypothetical protein